jgi:hypothetical protein
MSLFSIARERVDLNFSTNVATFALSRRNVKVRSKSNSSSKKTVACSTPVGEGKCEVCMSESAVCASSICNHASACAECLIGHVRSRIETDPAAWVPCPAVGCEEPLDVEHLLVALVGDESNNPWRVPILFLSKQLVRLPEWVGCDATSSMGGGGSGGNADKCAGGVLVSKVNEGKQVPCPVCSKSVAAIRLQEQEDEEIAKMKADGVIRCCPACRHPTMKEYGVCNVICCEICGIWWNWRTSKFFLFFFASPCKQNTHIARAIYLKHLLTCGHVYIESNPSDE